MPIMPAHLTDELSGELEWIPADLAGASAGDGATGDPSRPLFLNADERGEVQANGKPSLTIQEAAVQITRSGYTWNGRDVFNTPTNVTFAFRSNAPGTMPDETSGFSRFSAAQIAATLDALAAWSDVANITFTRVGAGTSGDGAYSDSATMLFGNYSAGADGAAAFAYYPTDRSHASLAGDVWINSTYSYNTNPQMGRYGFLTLVHEIGHAIGLGHPGEYDASDEEGESINYANSAEYFEDSHQFTLMSYFTEGNTGANFGPYYPAAPMLDDIAAAQRLYGANMSTRTGDTTYGFNANAGRAWFEASAARPPVFAVWDAGGVDTFDFSGYSDNQVIDLRAGHFSSVGGYLGNVAIAAGAMIENAIGGSGADLIFANAAANVINGGGGVDTVSYAGSTSAVTVRLWNGTGAGGHAQGDSLVGIENATGSRFNDSLIGDGGDNILRGGDGDDFLSGQGGADALIGGAGADTADYASSKAAVTVRLWNGTAQGGDAQGDVLTSIERVVGSAFNDALVGSSGVANRLDGGAGDDFLAGLSGADTLIGGAGVDTADYSGSGAGVVVRLWNGTGAGGDAEGDRLSGVENLNGSAHRDSLVGADGVANRLDGRAGDDFLFGLSGDDVLIGGRGADRLDGGDGVDTADYSLSMGRVTVRLWNGSGAGGDAEGDVLVSVENVTGSAFNDSLVGADGVANLLSGGTGDDHLFGLGGNDVLLGGAGADHLEGGAGADVLHGGGGIDTASYASSSAGVVVRLWNSTGAGGDAEGDTLVEVENVVGSRFGDSLVGSDEANVLTGGDGNDYLFGLDGDDVIIGGRGSDYLSGGAGDDRFEFAADSGADLITDFSAGAAVGDVLDLRATSFSDFADVLAHTTDDGSGGTVISKDGLSIVLQGVLKADLHANDFVFAAGPAFSSGPAGAAMPATDPKARQDDFGDTVPGAGSMKASGPLWKDALVASENAPAAAPALDDGGFGLDRAARLLSEPTEYDWIW